jgi:phage terminase large subunit GpA-like protein
MAGDLAADEWRASRASDEENAEREMRQFVWCLPVVPQKWEQTSLEHAELAKRIMDLARGQVPADTQYLTAAVDIGKYLIHWIVVAWRENATGHIADYGRIEVASDHLGVEQAILVALKQFREQVMAGWPVNEPTAKLRVPDQVWIDAGYMSEVVYAFCRQEGARFKPAVGRGAAQQHRQWYNRPTSTGAIVKHLGEGFHINALPAERLHLVEVDSDHWKTWVHQRLAHRLARTGR